MSFTRKKEDFLPILSDIWKCLPINIDKKFKYSMEISLFLLFKMFMLKYDKNCLRYVIQSCSSVSLDGVTEQESSKCLNYLLFAFLYWIMKKKAFEMPVIWLSEQVKIR